MRDWLAGRPRWHAHLTPTSASWLNQIERFFATLTEKQLRRSIHRSVGELHATIESFIQRRKHHLNGLLPRMAVRLRAAWLPAVR